MKIDWSVSSVFKCIKHKGGIKTFFFPFLKSNWNLTEAIGSFSVKKGVLRCTFAWESEAFRIAQSRGILTKLGALFKVCLLAWDIDMFWIITWSANSKQPGKIRFCILVKICIFSWYNKALCYFLASWEKSTFLSCRSSRPEVFCKKRVFRNFTKFTGKHLCQSLLFNKVAGLWLLLNFFFLNREGFLFIYFVWILWNQIKCNEIYIKLCFMN